MARHRPEYRVDIKTVDKNPAWIQILADLAVVSGSWVGFVLLMPEFIYLLLLKYYYRRAYEDLVDIKIIISKKQSPSSKSYVPVYEELIPEEVSAWTAERTHYRLQKLANKELIKEDFVCQLQEGKERIF